MSGGGRVYRGTAPLLPWAKFEAMWDCHTVDLDALKSMTTDCAFPNANGLDHQDLWSSVKVSAAMIIGLSSVCQGLQYLKKEKKGETNKSKRIRSMMLIQSTVELQPLPASTIFET